VICRRYTYRFAASSGLVNVSLDSSHLSFYSFHFLSFLKVLLKVVGLG
jgi:hypothetical protein